MAGTYLSVQLRAWLRLQLRRIAELAGRKLQALRMRSTRQRERRRLGGAKVVWALWVAGGLHGATGTAFVDCKDEEQFEALAVSGAARRATVLRDLQLVRRASAVDRATID
jgi:hypothetical protein